MPRMMNGLEWMVVSLAALASRLPAQQLEPRPLPSRGVESYGYQSATMGRRYDISVGLPSGYEATPGKKYPALIVTDGNLSFPIAYDAARSLQGVVEDVVVISVGAPFEEGDSAFVRRRVHESRRPIGR